MDETIGAANGSAQVSAGNRSIRANDRRCSVLIIHVALPVWVSLPVSEVSAVPELNESDTVNPKEV